MSLLNPRQEILKATQMASMSNEPDIASLDADEHHVLVLHGHENPKKQLDVSAFPLGREPSRKESLDNLRIFTSAEVDPHDRYISSEEEPSPSPDSDTASHYSSDETLSNEDDQGEHIQSMDKDNEGNSNILIEDIQAEIAIAVPIMVIGRPKLVDITNFAPIHKRKRSDSDKMTLTRAALNNAASRATNRAERVSKATETGCSIGQMSKGAISTDDSIMIPPKSWLYDEEIENVADEDREYFKHLEVRRPPSYIDYDPYALHPPKLSPRNSYSTPSKKPGSVARARRQASRPSLRKTSGAKEVSGSKKQRMLARGASERTEVPLIPTFPTTGK